MKWVAFLLAFGLFDAIGVMLVSVSPDAAAQSPFAAGSRLAIAANAPTDMPASNLNANRTQNYPESLQNEVLRKTIKKRYRNRCARITTTCWNAA